VIIVAEDDGVIIGTWAATDIVHLEGFWIHPDHRKKSRLPVRIVHTMVNTLRELGVTGTMANVRHGDTETASYVRRLGMVQLPVDTYNFKIE